MFKIANSSTNNFWSLADLFLQEPIRGWKEFLIEFHSTKTIRGGDRKWKIEYKIGVNFLGMLEIKVFILEEKPEGKEDHLCTFSPAQFKFMQSVERRMHSIGFKGSFHPDFLGCGFSTCFYKNLKSIEEAKQEICLLNKLNLGRYQRGRHGAK